MKGENTFYTDLNRGKIGEKRVSETLRARNFKVTDVSKDREYQRKDIDMLVEKNGKNTTLEIKTQDIAANTGNVFLENRNIYNRRANERGWFLDCQARHIGFAILNVCHIVELSELREYCRNNTVRYITTYDGEGYLFPMDVLTSLPSYYALELL